MKLPWGRSLSLSSSTSSTGSGTETLLHKFWLNCACLGRMLVSYKGSSSQADGLGKLLPTVFLCDPENSKTSCLLSVPIRVQKEWSGQNLYPPGYVASGDHLTFNLFSTVKRRTSWLHVRAAVRMKWDNPHKNSTPISGLVAALSPLCPINYNHIRQCYFFGHPAGDKWSQQRGQ